MKSAAALLSFVVLTLLAPGCSQDFPTDSGFDGGDGAGTYDQPTQEPPPPPPAPFVGATASFQSMVYWNTGAEYGLSIAVNNAAGAETAYNVTCVVDIWAGNVKLGETTLSFGNIDGGSALNQMASFEVLQSAGRLDWVDCYTSWQDSGGNWYQHQSSNNLAAYTLAKRTTGDPASQTRAR